jgi:hypothetical protein
MHYVKLYLDASPFAMPGTVKLFPERNHPESGYNYNQNLSALTLVHVMILSVIFR